MTRNALGVDLWYGGAVRVLRTLGEKDDAPLGHVNRVPQTIVHQLVHAADDATR